MTRVGTWITFLLLGGVMLFIGQAIWQSSRMEPAPIPPRPEVQVTILEGLTLAQIGERVREALPHITEEDWARAVGVGSPQSTHPVVLAANKPDSVDLEGYLFPDTYRFFVDASAEIVVEKLLDEMDEKLTPDLREAAAAQGHSLHEILTLASIVEREVRTDEDRALVADLFWRRLDIGMALQADSTVNYITGKKTPAVSNADRAIDSPWNTYLYPDLPPGPIAAPSLSSIQATVFPKPNDAWYFLTDETGTVHYASTNDEHNRNKALYLR